MFRSLKYLKKYRLESFFAPLFKLTEALLELLVPFVIRDLIDKGIGMNDSSYIISHALLLAGLSLVGLGFSITAQYFAAKASVGFACVLRHELMSHIGTLSHTELDELGTSQLITRMTSDINQVQTGVNMTLRLLLRSPFVVFGAMICAFTIDVHTAMIFVYTTVLLFIVVFAVMLTCIPLYKKAGAALDRTAGITRENLNGTRVIRAFGIEEKEIGDFRTANDALTKIQIFTGRISVLLNPVTFLIINLAIIWLIHRGALQVGAGVLTQGAVVALYNYMSQILVELIKLASLIITITRAIACGHRVDAMLETKNSLVSGKLRTVDENADAVRFDDVTFTYKNAGESSVEDIAFTVKKGETVGVIGGTGSGKSTAINLIPRFYDVTKGSVSVFGSDVKEYDVEFLRSMIGLVPQKAVLFEGTIEDNLRWGNEDATAEDMERALETAQATDVVKAKGGLSAHIEAGGKNLSGGQKQRLTIARALLRSPRILILDDSASALDLATDARLRKALSELDGDMTVMIVSQRISSIINADRIIVFDDGRIVGIGTHDELMKGCEVYRETASSQGYEGA